MDNHTRYLFVEKTSLKGETKVPDDLPTVEFSIDIEDEESSKPLFRVTIRQGHDDFIKIVITRGAEMDAIIKGFSFLVNTLQDMKNYNEIPF